MSYRYRSRLARNQTKKGKRKFLLSLIFASLLLYATAVWILPNFVGGLTIVSDLFRADKVKGQVNTADNAFFAPPVLTIPYEATSSSEIKIPGYAAPSSKVKIYLDDSLVTETDVNSDGSFITEGIKLNYGLNNIYGKTADDKNNESLPSKTIQVTFDNDKPFLEIYEPEDNKTITGGDKKITIRGKTEKEADIYINSQKIIVDSEGNFMTIKELNDGENLLTIKSQDLAGNSTEFLKKVTYNPS